MSRRPKHSTPSAVPETDFQVEPVSLFPRASEPLTLRLGDLAEALRVSRRTIERERSAGRFPQPDLHIGKAPLWTPETIRRWIASGGKREA